MRNLLNNADLGTDLEAHHAYLINFCWDNDHIKWWDDAGHFARLKMIARQYQEFKADVQAMTTFEELLKWMNERTHEVMMVPMNYVDNRRKPVPPLKVEFKEVAYDEDVNTQFRFFDHSEEPVYGIGWSGKLIVYPNKKLRFDSTAWRFGLASYGIYLDSGQYEGAEKDGAWIFGFSMLDRDFQLTDAKDPRWMLDPSLPDPDDNEISDWEDACNRAWEIEEGFADDEVFGDGYAR